MKNIILYISLLILTFLVTFSVNLPDFDLWARLAVGSIFFQTGTVLKKDIFSYLPTKDLWVDHEWGSGVVFYLFAKLFGEWGIFLIKALIIFSIFLLIAKIIQLQINRYPGIFFFLFLCFSLLPGIGGLVRCQMFTYLFFTLWLFLLERIRKKEKTLIWVFPVSMLLWVNMHGGFVAGIGLIVIYAVGEFLNRKPTLPYLGILALILPMTLINPYGYRLWTFMMDAAFMPRPYIGEWGPVSWSGPFHVVEGLKIHILAGFFIFVLLTLLVGLKLSKEKIKPDWTKILLVVIFLWVGIKHQRHTQFFTLAIPPLLYPHFIDLWNPLQAMIKKSSKGKFYQTGMFIKHNFGYILLVLILIYTMPKLSYRMMVNPHVYPVGSFEFIKQNHLSGNLATTYNWGSYAFWKLYPQCKILIDGRYEEVYSPEIYEMAMQFSEHSANWQEVLQKYQTDIIVLPKNNYRPSDVQTLKDWEIVYQDIVSAVLVRKSTIQPFYSFPDPYDQNLWKENYAKRINLNREKVGG